jgi:HK97 family phage portal protein
MLLKMMAVGRFTRHAEFGRSESRSSASDGFPWEMTPSKASFPMLQTIRSLGRSLADGIARRFRYMPVDADDGGDNWFRETDSGEVVGRHNAYTYAPWFRAINLVSACVAKTSLCLWQQKDGKWVKAKKHPAYKLLCGHGVPNDETLKYHFMQTLTAHAMGHGGGFAYIMRDGLAQPTELIQLRPDRTFPVRENGRLLFVTSIGGDYGSTGSEIRKLLAENVLHIHGLGWDGLTGYSVMELAARNLGSAIAKEKFGAKFFKNAATPGVIIKTPRKLSDTAMKHLKDSWQSLRTGLEESHKPIILEDEASAEAFTHTAADSQLLESVQWDPVTISNFTGVPPHMLGVKGYQSNSTLETQSQNLIDFTIDPWFLPWEQECAQKLLREAEKAAESHYWEFERKDLIRVDSEKRASIYRAGLGGHPWMKVSEVREDEGLDNEEDTDFIPSPLNMTGGAAGDAGSSDAGSGDPTGGDSEDPAALKKQIEDLKSQLEQKSKPVVARSQTGHSEEASHEALQQLWLDTTGRMARRLATAVARSKTGHNKAVLLAEHGETLRAAFGPLCQLTKRDAGTITDRLCEAIAAGTEVETIIKEIVHAQD